MRETGRLTHVLGQKVPAGHTLHWEAWPGPQEGGPSQPDAVLQDNTGSSQCTSVRIACNDRSTAPSTWTHNAKHLRRALIREGAGLVFQLSLSKLIMLIKATFSLERS